MTALAQFHDRLAADPNIHPAFRAGVAAGKSRALEEAFRKIREVKVQHHRVWVKGRAREFLRHPERLVLCDPYDRARGLPHMQPREALAWIARRLAEDARVAMPWGHYVVTENLRAARIAFRVLRRIESRELAELEAA